MEKKQNNISRRGFLKGTGLAGLTVGAASILGRPQSAQAAPLTTTSIYETVLGEDVERLYTRKGKSPGPVGPIAFEDRSIARSEIKSTLSCDLLVIGAGISGIIAALKAAEEGAKVIVLEKMTKGRGCFEDFGAVNSTVQKAKGVKTDKEVLIDEIHRSNNWRVRPEVIRTYVDKSGEAADFLQAMFNKSDRGFVFTPAPLRPGPNNGVQPIDAQVVFYDSKNLPPDVRSRSGHVGMYIVRDLTETAKKNRNITIHYLTPAVQLVRSGAGRVTGAIAKQDNSYIQVNATKGVILSTGGYDANPEMMQAYLRPEDYSSSSWWNPSWGTTGDGHMMGLKIGASMDPVPHAVMNFSFGNPESFQAQEVRSLRGMGQYIMINDEGKRFVREDAPFQGVSNAQNTQAIIGSRTWMVFDETMIAPSPEAAATAIKAFETYKARGWLYEGNSPESLARAMGMDVKSFQQTISDYNRYKKQNKDEEFNRDMAFAKEFSGKTYYAMSCNSVILATVSGLSIDGYGRVLDTNNKIIEGLYATGNASGNFFSGNYPRHIPGTSIGRAITLGYVTARHAVKGV